MKSRSLANCWAVRLCVPFRKSPAVTLANPSCPAGSAAEPVFTIAEKLTMGTPCFSITKKRETVFQNNFS